MSSKILSNTVSASGEGEGGHHIGVKTTFHDNESGKLAHIHPTLVSI